MTGRRLAWTAIALGVALACGAVWQHSQGGIFIAGERSGELHDEIQGVIIASLDESHPLRQQMVAEISARRRLLTLLWGASAACLIFGLWQGRFFRKQLPPSLAGSNLCPECGEPAPSHRSWCTLLEDPSA